MCSVRVPAWADGDRSGAAVGDAVAAGGGGGATPAAAYGACSPAALLQLPEFVEARKGTETAPLVAAVAILLHVARISDEYFTARAVEGRGAGTGVALVLPTASVAPSAGFFVYATNILAVMQSAACDVAPGGASKRWLGACGCIAVSRILAANLRRVIEVRRCFILWCAAASADWFVNIACVSAGATADAR